MDAQIQVRGQIGTVFVLVVSMFSCIVVFWNVERKLVPTCLSLSHSSLLWETLRSLKNKTATKKKVNPCPGEEGMSCFAFHEVRSKVLCLNSCSPWSTDNSPVQGHVSSTPDLRAGVGKQPGWTPLFLAVRAVAGLGMDSKGNKAHVITGCSPVFKALLISWGCSIPCWLPFKT